MKVRLAVIFLIWLCPVYLSACSCGVVFFCNGLQGSDSVIAFKGVVVDSEALDNDGQAIALKVLQVYRDDFGLTEIVELYGSINDASCDIPVKDYYLIGDTIHVLTTFDRKPQNSVFEEGNYENYLLSCYTAILRQTEGLIKGLIYRNDEGIPLYEFPLEGFEASLESCDFEEKEEEPASDCTESVKMIHPNPISKYNFQDKLNELAPVFDLIRVWSSNGMLIKSISNNTGGQSQDQNLLDLPPGLYFVELHCMDEKYVEKVLVF
ncbi:MAG: T9SS type A sorting domain-containing protein [Bacteroidetes bacterium]|nr:T9SS type A sorting domain-containing protein [Bacteroidota bacterium]